MSSPEPSRSHFRLLAVVLAIAAFEVLAIAVHYFRHDRIDIASAFARMAEHKKLRQLDVEVLARANSAERVALLVGESQSANPERVRTAVRLAERFGELDRLPPESRIKVFLEHDEDDDEAFVDAVTASSPETRKSLLQDLMDGRRDARANRMISIALGRTADADLVATMHAHLVSSDAPVNAWPILTAFAARTDLPLTDRDEDWPIYRRHLPGILDPATREALWIAAVRLARELPPAKHPLDESYDPGCGVLPPASTNLETLDVQDAFAGNKNVAWPLTDEKADAMAERVFSWISSDFAYAEALAIRWHRTKRLTIPHYPYEAPGKIDGMRRPLLHRARGKEAAKQILDPNQYANRTWGLTALGTGPRTDRGAVIALRSGRGPVRVSIECMLPGSTEFSPFRLGVRPQPGGSDLDLEEAQHTFESAGSLERVGPGTFRFDGTSGTRVASGGGSFGTLGTARSGEPILLYSGGGSSESSSGETDSESKTQAFVLLIPEADPALPAEGLWREAVTRFMTRWATAPSEALRKWTPWSPAEFDPQDLAQLLRLTSWIPVPEAREPLRKLWSRRDELTADLPGDQSLAGLVAASLLMSGDEAPLEDPAWIEKLDDEDALRLFLFSPATAWPKLDARAEPAVTAPIAERVAALVSERGDSTSKVSLKAAGLRQTHLLQSTWSAGPYLVVALVLVAAAILRRRPGNAETEGLSLIVVGLIPQFLSVELGGRLWLPLAGDLLLIAGAFRMKQPALGVIAILMALSGLLPENDAGRLLVAVFLATLSVLRLRAGDVRRFEAVAHLAMWTLLIVPLAVSVAGEFLPARNVRWPAFGGLAALLYLAATFLPPFAIVLSWRGEALRRPATS
jgi:hypothetical protein